ncbi:MAG: hypothetical protein JW834_03240 [Candidatus Diapherotrites archaeon]|nr:hypothetical protein [Candidatus Diapherotrites archaeon]
MGGQGRSYNDFRRLLRDRFVETVSSSDASVQQAKSRALGSWKALLDKTKSVVSAEHHQHLDRLHKAVQQDVNNRIPLRELREVCEAHGVFGAVSEEWRAHNTNIDEAADQLRIARDRARQLHSNYARELEDIAKKHWKRVDTTPTARWISTQVSAQPRGEPSKASAVQTAAPPQPSTPAAADAAKLETTAGTGREKPQVEAREQERLPALEARVLSAENVEDELRKAGIRIPLTAWMGRSHAGQKCLRIYGARVDAVPLAKLLLHEDNTILAERVFGECPDLARKLHADPAYATALTALEARPKALAVMEKHAERVRQNALNAASRYAQTLLEKGKSQEEVFSSETFSNGWEHTLEKAGGLRALAEHIGIELKAPEESTRTWKGPGLPAPPFPVDISKLSHADQVRMVCGELGQVYSIVEIYNRIKDHDPKIEYSTIATTVTNLLQAGRLKKLDRGEYTPTAMLLDERQKAIERFQLERIDKALQLAPSAITRVDDTHLRMLAENLGLLSHEARVTVLSAHDVFTNKGIELSIWSMTPAQKRQALGVLGADHPLAPSLERGVPKRGRPKQEETPVVMPEWHRRPTPAHLQHQIDVLDVSLKEDPFAWGSMHIGQLVVIANNLDLLSPEAQAAAISKYVLFTNRNIELRTEKMSPAQTLRALRLVKADNPLVRKLRAGIPKNAVLPEETRPESAEEDEGKQIPLRFRGLMNKIAEAIDKRGVPGLAHLERSAVEYFEHLPLACRARIVSEADKLKFSNRDKLLSKLRSDMTLLEPEDWQRLGDLPHLRELFTEDRGLEEKVGSEGMPAAEPRRVTALEDELGTRAGEMASRLLDAKPSLLEPLAKEFRDELTDWLVSKGVTEDEAFERAGKALEKALKK